MSRLSFSAAVGNANHNMIQQMLPIGQYGIPLEIELDQPDPVATEARLAEAHAICEAFREYKRQHLEAIRRMLEQESRLTTAGQIEKPKQ
jgi:hypothetical protein